LCSAECDRDRYTTSGRIYLDSFALDYLTVSTLGVEFEPVRIEFEMFLLPRLEERSAKFQYLALDDAVRRTDYVSHTHIHTYRMKWAEAAMLSFMTWRLLPISALVWVRSFIEPDF